jgi:PRTRC genetic system protein E
MSTPATAIAGGFFAQLMPMLADRTVMMIVSKADEHHLTVSVIPKTIRSDDDNDALTAPLCVTGTAEELDRDLARQVRDFAEAQATTSSNLAQVKKDLEAAEKAAREEAKKKTAKAKVMPPAAAERKADDPPRAPEPPQMMSLFESEVKPSADANQASTNTSNQPVVD